jgi:type VI protein secretion system component Hcp
VASDLPDVYLRFLGKWGSGPLKGECMDEKHPGEAGWIQIKSFSFGFGVPETGDSFQAKTGKAKTQAEINKEAAEKKAAEKKKQKDSESWGKSGPLNFDKFSFAKSTDRLSAALIAICHDGNYKIPKVVVEAVRYGGASEDVKIPFLRLVFEQVRLKSCKLNLTNEDLPAEDVEFEYDIVNVSCLWTDNATGDRRPERPIRAGWNLLEQKQSAVSGTVDADD